MFTKQQLQTALNDINNVGQNVYNIYCFETNCSRIETDDTIVYVNTVPDSIKVIKQLLEEKLKEDGIF